MLLLLLEEGEEEGAVGAASLCMEYVSTLLILSPIVIVAVDPSFFMTVTRAPGALPDGPLIPHVPCGVFAKTKHSSKFGISCLCCWSCVVVVVVVCCIPYIQYIVNINVLLSVVEYC